MVGILVAPPGNPLPGEAGWHEVCKAAAQHEPNAQREQDQRQPNQDKVGHGTHWIATVTRWEPLGFGPRIAFSIDRARFSGQKAGIVIANSKRYTKKKIVMV